MRTSRALRATAKSLADIGDARRSWELFQVITDPVDRQIAAESVAPALVRRGLVDDAESLFKSLPNNARARSTRAAMAVAYAEIDDRKRADEAIQSLAGTPQYVVGLSRLAIYLASKGDLASATEASRRAADKATAFNHSGAQNVLVSVAGALAAVGKVEDALRVARGAGSAHTVQAAIAEVASMLAETGDIEPAKTLLQELTRINS
jgi:lipopolysaccharide biosynthesis regulator YciM